MRTALLFEKYKLETDNNGEPRFDVVQNGELWEICKDNGVVLATTDNPDYA